MFLLICTASSGRACEHLLKAIRLRNLSHFTVSLVRPLCSKRCSRCNRSKPFSPLGRGKKPPRQGFSVLLKAITETTAYRHYGYGIGSRIDAPHRSFPPAP